MIAAFAASASSAGAATINVACGDVTALRAAITTANATTTPDTIEVTGAPCNFNVPNAVVVSPSGNTGLPVITQPLTINGHGATVRRTGATDYRLLLASTPNFSTIPRVELRELGIANGRLAGASQNGAGIAGFLADLVLDRAVVTGNSTAGRGGGIAITGGSIDADRSVIAFNAAAFGGGLYTTTTATSNDITRSSFYFNAASGNTGAMLLENGTGLVENSTVAANAAPNGIGGVTAFTSSASAPANLTVRSSTLGDNGASGNPAPGTSLAAIASVGAATITATDTIVVDTDSTAAPISPPCLEGGGGTIVAAGGNVEWPTTSCDFETEADPRVQYLFGGFAGVELFAKLLRDSAAIDNGGPDCPPIDQRGEPRPAGLACDSGSWETQPPDTTAQVTESPTAAPEITFSSSEPNSTFECRVDGGNWEPCTSPFTPTLPEGEHTVDVRAIDSDGDVDPTPASVTFVVDFAPETTTAECRRETLLLGTSCAVTVECPAANTGCTVEGSVDVQANKITGLVHGDVVARTPATGAAERSSSAECGFPSQLTSHCSVATETISVDPGDTAVVSCSSSRQSISIGLLTVELRCVATLTTNVGGPVAE